MSYSIQRAVSDGTLSSLSLSIQYYARTDISVYLSNVLWPVGTLWAWSGATGSTIKFKDPVPAGIEVLVKRITDVSDIRHNFSQGAQFTSTTLDDNFKQMLYVAQEAQEGGRSITDVYGDIDMHGFKVRNMGAATELSGAAQLAQAGGGSTGNTPGITYQSYTGDGSKTAFPLGASSLSMFVFVSGAYQQSTSWGIVGSSIVFSEAPPAGVPIEVLSLGTAGTSAAATSFAPTVSIPMTNVQDALMYVDAKSAGYIQLSDYCKGDGSNETAQFQKALDAGNAQNRVVDGRNLKVTIAGPLYMAGPGLVFDRVGYDPGIYVTGVGYTALTVTGRPNHFDVMCYGSGNECNGILFQNTVVAKIDQIRAYNLRGFGVRMNKVWDSLFGTISVELCGSPAEAAFGMYDDGDTCNMLTIGRIQVERAPADSKAMYISPNSLCLVINAIHSEQAGSADAWVIAGNRCTFNNLRFHSNAANAIIRIGGNDCTFTNLMTEGSLTVQWDGANGATNTLVTPEINGTLRESTNQYGELVILGGSIKNYAGSMSRLRRFGVRGTTNMPFTPVLTFGGNAVGQTYGQQRGEYSIVGNRVIGHLVIGMTAKGTSTGTAAVAGLPFKSRANSIDSTSTAVLERVVYPGIPVAFMGANSDLINLASFQSHPASSAFLTDAAFTGNPTIRINFDYPIG